MKILPVVSKLYQHFKPSVCERLFTGGIQMQPHKRMVTTGKKKLTTTMEREIHSKEHQFCTFGQKAAF